MILSKKVNQNMFKNSFFLKKFVKIRQALEVPPPDPSWLPADGGSAPRPPPPCDLTYTYSTATKRSKFVTLFNEGFKEKTLVKTFFLENTLYIWKYFVLNIRVDSPRPQTVLFSYGYDSATSPSIFFWRKLVKFWQVLLDLCKFKVKFGKI